jgi:hypothetical protein
MIIHQALLNLNHDEHNVSDIMKASDFVKLILIHATRIAFFGLVLDHLLLNHIFVSFIIFSRSVL